MGNDRRDRRRFDHNHTVHINAAILDIRYRQGIVARGVYTRVQSIRSGDNVSIPSGPLVTEIWSARGKRSIDQNRFKITIQGFVIPCISKRWGDVGKGENAAKIGAAIGRVRDRHVIITRDAHLRIFKA